MWYRKQSLGVLLACAAACLPAAGLAQTGADPDETPSSVPGWQPGDPGERLHIRGRVVGSDGRPVPGALLHVRQADGTGSYQASRYRGRLAAGEDGSFQMVTVLPGQYWGAKHIHVLVSHPDYVPIDTRILFRGDPNIDETEGDLAIAVEEISTDEGKSLAGGVEFVLEPK